MGRRGVPRPLPGLRRQPTSAVAIQGLVFRGLGFRVKISSASKISPQPGLDRSGKSTQSKKIASYLEKASGHWPKQRVAFWRDVAKPRRAR